MGSGKTTVGRYLESRYGFQYLRYSAVLAQWRAQSSDNKSQLQETGWQVMAGGQQAELNNRLIAQIQPECDVAVDGLRHPLDFESLSKVPASSFHLLFIESTPSLRFDRLKNKGKYNNFESFVIADSHSVEQQIGSLRPSASLVITNESSLIKLYDVIDEAVIEFRKEGER
jgi:dephospho-CoA kinase